MKQAHLRGKEMDIPEWFLRNYYNTVVRFKDNRRFHYVLFPGIMGPRYFDNMEDALQAIADMIHAPLLDPSVRIEDTYSNVMSHCKKWISFIEAKSTKDI